MFSPAYLWLSFILHPRQICFFMCNCKIKKCAASKHLAVCLFFYFIFFLFYLLRVGGWSWGETCLKKVWWFCRVTQIVCESCALCRTSSAQRSCALVQILPRHMVRNSQGCSLWCSHKKEERGDQWGFSLWMGHIFSNYDLSLQIHFVKCQLHMEIITSLSCSDKHPINYS